MRLWISYRSYACMLGTISVLLDDQVFLYSKGSNFQVIELENSDRPLEDIQKECQIGM